MGTPFRYVSGTSGQFDAGVGEILNAILATEITPELVPVVAGETPQSTEAKVGPYELQDFNLFYTLRYGFRPSKIAFLAVHAWGDTTRGEWPPEFPAERRRAYDRATISAWLKVFLQRFFGFSQFKRSALPNGPKVSAGGSLYARWILGIPVHDLTGGFKCLRREVLEGLDLDAIASRGYAFQIETTYRALRGGFRVVEVPIAFADREQGGSKMSRRIVLEAAWKVPALRLAALRGNL